MRGRKDPYIIAYRGGEVQRDFARGGAEICYIYYMIFTDTGIVLFRQDFREADRIAALYTLEHGRINLRFPGVNRAKGKLKALSEPFACAAYRVYVRGGSALGTVTGGKLESVFPSVRRSLKRQTLAMHCCELIMRLTPQRQPSPGKYRLLLQALTELEYADPTPAFAPAFTLRLMEQAGFGLDRPVLQISSEFWRRMHEDAFSSLDFTSAEDLLSLAKCNEVCRRFLNQYLNFPLKTLQPFTLSPEELSQAASQTSPAEALAI